MHFLLIACTLAAVAAAPATYDQRQDGEGNVQMDLKDIMFIVGVPKNIPNELLSLFLKSAKRSGDQPIAQDRADTQLTAFVEPSTPYRVIIGGEGERLVETDGSNAIVIAGRRRLEAEEPDEMKLIGATEQCGPERRRDPVTLMCKSITDLRAVIKPDITPEVVPVPT
ncbi:uncharacterized protein LOC112044214 [Bicyclus anynana]|uniref:Uncharacterized protein LOC112044214 n=1 Tax=Bicyclus anynana TaxID=110368 RepID=A0A6J1MMM1_BICAN|nr:uncharacterized protein LOC112044214 [Bicyclus anynana]